VLTDIEEDNVVISDKSKRLAANPFQIRSFWVNEKSIIVDWAAELERI